MDLGGPPAGTAPSASAFSLATGTARLDDARLQGVQALRMSGRHGLAGQTWHLATWLGRCKPRPKSVG